MTDSGCINFHDIVYRKWFDPKSDCYEEKFSEVKTKKV